MHISFVTKDLRQNYVPFVSSTEVAAIHREAESARRRINVVEACVARTALRKLPKRQRRKALQQGKRRWIGSYPLPSDGKKKARTVPSTPMNSCRYCDEPLAPEVVQCPSCGQWFTDELISRLTHPDPAAREAAAHNLVVGERNEAAAIALGRALHDPVQDVGRAAGVTLYTFGIAAKHAVPALIAALDHHDYFIRRTAAAALSCVGSHGRPAVQRLAELKCTDDRLLRAWVGEALKRMPAE